MPPTIHQDSLNLEIAKKLLSLPLLIGTHTETGEEMLMGIGKFGPYIKYQNKFTSIPKNIDPFSLNAQEAVKIIEAKAAKAKK